MKDEISSSQPEDQRVWGGIRRK